MTAYAAVRTYRQLSDFDRVVQLVQEGLVPILREVSGFRGYYAIRCGERAGVSLTLSATKKAARAGQHGVLPGSGRTSPSFMETTRRKPWPAT